MFRPDYTYCQRTPAGFEQDLSFWQQVAPTAEAFLDVEFIAFCDYSGACTHRAKLATPDGYLLATIEWTPCNRGDGFQWHTRPIEGWRAWQYAALFGDFI